MIERQIPIQHYGKTILVTARYLFIYSLVVQLRRSEFENLFKNFDYETIRDDILNRRIVDSNFVTCLWRIALHCLPRDRNQWTDMLNTSRTQYEEMYHRNRIDPYKQSQISQDKKNINHPLAQDQEVRTFFCLPVFEFDSS